MKVGFDISILIKKVRRFDLLELDEDQKKRDKNQKQSNLVMLKGPGNAVRII